MKISILDLNLTLKTKIEIKNLLHYITWAIQVKMRKIYNILTFIYL
jgi:hypothetical protein